jgi:chromosome segregation ATPase
MKNRIGVIVLILVLVCAGLGIALIAVKHSAVQEQQVLSEKNTTLSNDLVQANDQLGRQRQANALMESDREERRKAYDALTNNYTQTLVTLAQTSNSLVKTETALKVTQEEVVKRDAKIADLETQNQTLDKQAIELTTAITNLTTEIEETKRRLATSEGEKGFLEKELKRLMAEKSELERQFNDLTVLKAQVSKLKSELAVARRLDWIRKGLFASTDEKGAQRLMKGPTSLEAKAPKQTYDLNVEVNADGSVKVIPPLTNRPAATPPSGK